MFVHLPCSWEPHCFWLEGHQELPGPHVQEPLGQAEPLGLFSAQVAHREGCRARQAGLPLHMPPQPGSLLQEQPRGVPMRAHQVRPARFQISCAQTQ